MTLEELITERRACRIRISELTAEIDRRRTELPESDALGRPDGRDPAAFYRSVAEAYRREVLAGGSPAKAIAVRSGVPVTTVHRWILEARLRGHLAPARVRGAAG